MSKKKTDELVDLKDEVVDLMLYNFWDLEKIISLMKTN